MTHQETLRRHPTNEWILGMQAQYPTEPTIDSALTHRLHKRKLDYHYTSPSIEEVSARLKAFLGRETNGATEIHNLRRMTGGASKEQFVFELDWIKDGEERRREPMVLRCDPFASIVETHRRREFELMRFGAKLMPVPPVYWLDDTGNAMGSPAMIAGFVKGVQKPAATLSNVTGIGIHFPKEYRDTLCPEYVASMVALHKAPIEAEDLPSFVRPTTGSTEASDLIVNWWARVWAEDRYEDAPISTLTEAWLRANAPVLDQLSVVHGDFRTGNFLFDDAERRITAVLDWELGYLGDRHGDLGWVLTDLYVTRESGAPFHCGLFSSENELIERYEAAGGLPIDRKTLHWHKVFCTWKQFILSLGCALRAAEGLSHQDVLLTWLAGGGYPISEALRRLLEEA